MEVSPAWTFAHHPCRWVQVCPAPFQYASNPCAALQVLYLCLSCALLSARGALGCSTYIPTRFLIPFPLQHVPPSCISPLAALETRPCCHITSHHKEGTHTGCKGHPLHLARGPGPCRPLCLTPRCPRSHHRPRGQGCQAPCAARTVRSCACGYVCMCVDKCVSGCGGPEWEGE